MLIKSIFFFLIYSSNILCNDEILVLFDHPIVLNNSTINWSNAQLSSCFSQTTTMTEQTSIESLTTVSPSNSSLIGSYTCSDGSYGVYCNISSNICQIINPCLNGGLCYANQTLSYGYYCQCLTDFSGYDCEYDNRICSENTCWNNGTCIVLNTTNSSFTCQCVHGYDGINCELETDLCTNITCENNGVCMSSYLVWTCQCLDSSSYNGEYCQYKSSALVQKELISKSFAIIAIVALACLFGFVIIMDILKYVFKIDPVDRERHRLRLEKEKKEARKFPTKKRKKKNTFLTPVVPF